MGSSGVRRAAGRYAASRLAAAASKVSAKPAATGAAGDGGGELPRRSTSARPARRWARPSGRAPRTGRRRRSPRRQPRARAVTRRPMTSRGHGHWPCAARLASSMATMATRGRRPGGGVCRTKRRARAVEVGQQRRAGHDKHAGEERGGQRRKQHDGGQGMAADGFSARVTSTRRLRASAVLSASARPGWPRRARRPRPGRRRVRPPPAGRARAPRAAGRGHVGAAVPVVSVWPTMLTSGRPRACTSARISGTSARSGRERVGADVEVGAGNAGRAAAAPRARRRRAAGFRRPG